MPAALRSVAPPGSIAPHTAERAKHLPPSLDRTGPASRTRAVVDAASKAHRLAVARDLDEELRAHHDAGDVAKSNRALGKRCGVDERKVREWRSGETALPYWAVELLPDIVQAGLEERRKRRAKAAASSLSIETRALRVQSAVGDLARTVVEALPDGVDERERRAIDLRALEVMHECEALRAVDERGKR